MAKLGDLLLIDLIHSLSIYSTEKAPKSRLNGDDFLESILISHPFLHMGSMG